MSNAKKAPFTAQGRNSTAVNTLRSWLRAVGIDVQPSKAAGCDLVVTKEDGTLMQVQVALDAAQDPAGDVQVLAGVLTGKKLSEALEGFWKVTDAAGYERLQPISRGAEPEANDKGNPRKLHYRDNAFDVAIRHTEFRRSVNPPAHVWAQYKPTMERVAWGFFRLNDHLCKRNGLDINDLFQYARCWIVNFCTRYETANPTHFDNERKLYRYLQQRFHCDLQPLLLKQERSVLPNEEAVAVALFSDPGADLESSPNPESILVAKMDRLNEDEDEIEEIDYDYIARNCQLDLSSQAARKASASEKLGQLLESMPHDRMVDILTSTTTNANVDFSARKEANRRLRTHQEGCDICTPKEVKTVLFDAAIIPQAAQLDLVRAVVTGMKNGLTTVAELIEAMGVDQRQVRYYQRAAVMLGFVGGGVVTATGQELAQTTPGSDEEKAVFRAAVLGSSELSLFSWYFEDGEASPAKLLKFVMENFEVKSGAHKGQKLSVSTAKHRVGTFNNWKRSIGL
jgi:hypothetical protein